MSSQKGPRAVSFFQKGMWAWHPVGLFPLEECPGLAGFISICPVVFPTLSVWPVLRSTKKSLCDPKVEITRTFLVGRLINWLMRDKVILGQGRQAVGLAVSC